MSFIDIKSTARSVGQVIKQSYGPLARLELPFNLGDVYRYPLDVGDSNLYPHTIELQAWLPTPVPVSEVVEGAKNAVSSAIDKFKNRADSTLRGINEVSRGVAGGVRGSALRTANNLRDGSVAGIDTDTPQINRNQRLNPRLLDFTRRAKRSDLIALYLPNSPWDDTIENSYNAVSATEAFGNAGLVVEAGSSAIKAAQEGEQDLLSMLINGFKGAVNSPAAMEKGAEILGGEAGKNLGLAAMGYAINPQEEMLYGGTAFRTFMFEFTMTPRNLQEAQSIRDIIKKLKYHASPQFADNQGRWVIPPSYFDIQFKFNGTLNPNLPKISTCALTQVRVNYSGGLEQWATYEDGMPISVSLTLAFTELEMMHKALREEGY
jgi:hypothetical protein